MTHRIFPLLQTQFLLTFVLVSFYTSSTTMAAPTAEQLKELSAIQKELTNAAKLIRKNDIDEAEATVNKAEERMNGLLQQDETIGKLLQSRSIQRVIEIRRQAIDKKKGKSGDPKGDASTSKASDSKTSFVRDVAPILTQKCGRCHGERKSAGLQLNTFENMKSGSKSGVLLIPGKPEQSLLIARITHSDPKQRMPRNAPALSDDEIKTIAGWISDGALFDGKNPKATLAELIAADIKQQRSDIDVPRTTGNETVSFKRDIAPFMINLCLRCHNDKQPRSEFSVETVRAIMLGGETGTVVTPGNLDESRLWDLVGKQDPIKMPQGQALITRKNWNDLRTWITEGARYDGNDPDQKLTELVGSGDPAASTNMKSSAELLKLHREQSESNWKRVTGSTAPQAIETDDFLIYTDVTAERLAVIEKQCKGTAENIRKLLNIEQSPLVAGKLPIFVFKDAFEVNEFQQLLLRQRSTKPVTGFAKVTANQEEAYVVIRDDMKSDDKTGSWFALYAMQYVMDAALQSGQADVPPWVGQGAGLYFADKPVANDVLFRSMTRDSNFKVIASDDRILFRPNGLAPDQAGPVGYVLFSLINVNGGPNPPTEFVRTIHAGEPLDEAIKNVYRADPKKLNDIVKPLAN